MVHDFGDSLRRGERAEAFLDALFSRYHRIRPATREEQRQGIDRVFTPYSNPGRRLSVEYKTDWRAHQTGRVFIELISVDTAGKAGWALTSGADYLVYFVVHDDLIYVLRFAVLRRHLDGWRRVYAVYQAQNRGYATHGLCVDQSEFERRAEVVINLADVPDLPPMEVAY